MNNERSYDLPLQINHNIYNARKEGQSRSKDMPKQISNDVYRHNFKGKENAHHKCETKNMKSPYVMEDELLFSEKSSEIKKQNNRSSHLRDIIKKKLFTAEKNGLTLQPRNVNIKQLKPSENEPKLNRYQSLLNQIYGTPRHQRERVKRHDQKVTQKKQSEFQMKRHQSVRNVTEVLKTEGKESDMGRYRSQSTLNKVPICSDCKEKRKNSSKLKSQLLKIPTYLDLYNQKKKLVLAQ